MALDTLNTALQAAQDNPLALAGVALGTGAIVGGVAGAAITSSVKKKKRRKSRRGSRKVRHKRRKGKRNRRRYYPEPRGRNYSRRKIRKTKNGQPYIILASGKSRFIKKSSSRRSKKLKGGRY